MDNKLWFSVSLTLVLLHSNMCTGIRSIWSVPASIETYPTDLMFSLVDDIAPSLALEAVEEPMPQPEASEAGVSINFLPPWRHIPHYPIPRIPVVPPKFTIPANQIVPSGPASGNPGSQMVPAPPTAVFATPPPPFYFDTMPAPPVGPGSQVFNGNPPST